MARGINYLFGWKRLSSSGIIRFSCKNEATKINASTVFSLDFIDRFSSNSRSLNLEIHMISSRNNWLSLAITFSFFLGVFNATADQFGTTVATDWQTWTVFSQGGGVSDTAEDQTGSGYVKGKVGVWGNGNVSLSGSAIIDGDLFYRTTGTLKISGQAKITGVRHHDASSDSLLQQSSTEAFMESDQLWAQPATNTQYTTINSSQNFTISGSGHVVLKLTDFVLTGGTLTLQALAPGTTFVFNVSNQFSLSGTSRIVLSAGLQPSQVIFNVRGTGSDVTLSGNSSFQGILLANYRNASVSSGATVNGEVVANKVSISGSARLTKASP